MFSFLTAGFTFVLCIVCLVLECSSSIYFDDWFLNLFGILPFFSVIIAVFLLSLAGIDSMDETNDITKASDNPISKRPWYFYLLFLIIAPGLPLYFMWSCGLETRSMLGTFPIILAASSLFADILLIVSNKRHNIGIHDPWSNIGCGYAILVAIIYPILHSAYFIGAFNGTYGVGLQYIDPFVWYFVYILVGVVVYFISWYALNFLIFKIAGHKLSDISKNVSGADSGNFSSGGVDMPSYTEPSRPYRSILDAPEISDHYYGRHGEFDRNDESRRISEDIQQFHRSHPDADLSDHYSWEDILDAETDGYLDEY